MRFDSLTETERVIYNLTVNQEVRAHVARWGMLLDLDGTLADRDAAFRGWSAAFLASYGVCHPGEVVWLIDRDQGGRRPRHQLFEDIRSRYEIPVSVEELTREYRANLAAYLPVASDEVVSALRWLRINGWGIAVVSNGPVSQHRKVTALGILDHVDAVLVSDEVGAEKPAPAIFISACSRIGVTPARAWMVGDDPLADIVGSAACGLRAAWVSGGRDWPGTLVPRPLLMAPTAEEALAQVIARHEMIGSPADGQ